MPPANLTDETALADKIWADMQATIAEIKKKNQYIGEYMEKHFERRGNSFVYTGDESLKMRYVSPDAN